MARKQRISPLTADERETVILLDDGSDIAKISTHQRAIYNKLEKNPSATLVEDISHGSTVGGIFELPAEFISFRSVRRKRTFTPEQKAKQKEQAAKASKAFVAKTKRKK